MACTVDVVVVVGAVVVTLVVLVDPSRAAPVVAVVFEVDAPPAEVEPDVVTLDPAPDLLAVEEAVAPAVDCAARRAKAPVNAIPADAAAAVSDRICRRARSRRRTVTARPSDLSVSMRPILWVVPVRFMGTARTCTENERRARQAFLDDLKAGLQRGHS